MPFQFPPPSLLSLPLTADTTSYQARAVKAHKQVNAVLLPRRDLKSSTRVAINRNRWSIKRKCAHDVVGLERLVCPYWMASTSR